MASSKDGHVTTTAMSRLQQTSNHLVNGDHEKKPQMSSSHGPTEPKLLDFSMGQFLDEQARQYPDSDAIIVSWSNTRYTFRELNERSKEVARGLLAAGVKSQDRIGIFSGNCERYVELFFAVCRIGAIFVVLNPSYTPVECENALKHAGCSILFTALDVGRKDQTPLLKKLVNVIENDSSSLPDLKKIIFIRGENPFPENFQTYDSLVANGSASKWAKRVDELTESVDAHELCNFQFTSGTTGAPKAVTLSHHNVINNGLVTGNSMRLRQGDDVICCPPPLYHAFGLCLGLLGTYTHGVPIIFPSWSFEPEEVMEALVKEHCTGLLGVPTMLVAVLKQYRQDPERWGKIHLRTGIAAGSLVPRYLMEQLQETFGMPELVNIYGMTEVSGASHSTPADADVEDKLATVGLALPHTRSKVVDAKGNIVPCGTRGEICMAGFGVHKGYYQNPEKTKETCIKDEDGVLWVHSGDEASMDSRGYCKITGRIKDMIIRGGENIYPFEIEQRLGQHPAISQSSVVGLKDDYYGEIVAAFLEQQGQTERPSDEEVQEFVKKTLGNYNVPVHIFWIGPDEELQDFPKTSSGKIKKVELRNIGNKSIGRE